MKLEHKKINFEDARGTIRDIFQSEPKEHCTVIHSKKNSIRGNHLHKTTVQHDLVVIGRMLVLGRKEGSDVIEEMVQEPGDLITWEKGEAHELIALDDLIFVTFHNGPRGGEDFEKDTTRLEVPLHKAAGKTLEDLLAASA